MQLFDIPSGITLSRLTAAITRAVSSSPELFGVWVMAELSDVRVSGGHCYMELIEKNEAGTTVAKLKANIWQSTFNQLRRKFFQVTGRDIATGLKVLVKGNATHHSIYGLSFNITDIDPSYTIGDMERLRREILQRLSREGILEHNKQRTMPIAPQKIAVISAENAAGYGDFMNHLMGNREGFVFYPCLFPCAMQGDRVSSSIREALDMIEATSDLWDCVVIVRGGGATTDLNGFDDYELAKAVALCGLPIVVGIGHDRDKNVLDDIAHTSVKTPTAVAAFFIELMTQAYERATSAFDKIREFSVDNLRGEENRLTTIQTLLPQLISRRMSEAESSLKIMAGRVPILVDSALGKEKQRLEGVKSLISAISASRIDNSQRRLNEIKEKVEVYSNNLLKKNADKIESINVLLGVLDFHNTLKRGYSITRINNKAVTDISQVEKGSRITTTFYNGEIESVVDI